MHKINWQDLQYVLVVARSGSVSSAARALGVNHTTVLRRINALEERQGVKLFDRLRTGYELNPDGQQLLQVAQSIEETVVGLERRIAGKELKLEGNIRVTTTDSVLQSVVGRHLVRFQKRYPDISIELTLTTNILSLTKRDADVAIRPSRFEPERLIGKRISDFVFGIYCGAEYWQKNAQRPLDEQLWLGPDDSMSGSPAGRWLQAELPTARIVFTADSFVALGDAARQNLGMTLLPCSQGDRTPGLVRVGAPLKEYSTGLWVLTHKDLLSSVRIRSFYDFMIDALINDQPMLSGGVQ